MSNFPTVINLLMGGVYSVHSEVGQPRVMMNFVVENLKFLFNLKKKEKETLWRLTLLCDFGCTFVYVNVSC